MLKPQRLNFADRYAVNNLLLKIAVTIKVSFLTVTKDLCYGRDLWEHLWIIWPMRSYLFVHDSNVPTPISGTLKDPRTIGS